MRILLTGAAGKLGSQTLKYLLRRNHSIVALDRIPEPSFIADLLQDLPAEQRGLYKWYTLDLTNFAALETLMKETKVESVIHLGSIPDPLSLDPRVVHNNNVVGSYNIMQTAAQLGIRRIAQASSVNATGLSYTPEGHHRFYEMPVTETHPVLPEDPYALSKAICETQADALVRYYPGLRIASLRFHMVKDDYDSAIPHSRPQDCFAWTSYEASASSCLRSLLSDGWEGHEVFNVAAPEICWEGGLSSGSDQAPHLKGKVPTMELLETFWDGRVTGWNREYWAGSPRRTTYDSSKAERLLGWDHDRAADIDL